MLAADEQEGDAPPSEAVISLRGVEKEYLSGEVSFKALSGVSLEIPRGQYVAIIGASGSGKSTMMNILGCLDRPTAGTFFLAGHDVSELGNDERAFVRSELLGFIFQGFNLLARTTAVENVELPLVYRGVDADERRERSTRALQLVGLGDRLKHTSTQLSGGQQQRVAIARALVTDPEVLLADEPTGNLDSRTTEEILAMLQWLNREHGLTIVMVTHEADVAACASRIVTMKDGLVQSDVLVDQPRRASPPAGTEPWMLQQNRNVDDPAEEGLFGRQESRSGSFVLAAFMALRLALRSLSRSKLRAGLTALGILIGIAAVVTTSALGAGARGRMESSMQSLGVNLLIISPAPTNTAGARGAMGSAATLTDGDAAAIAREVPTVAAVAPVLGSNTQVVAGDRNAATRVTGTTPGYFTARNWTVALGAFWDESDVRSGARVCAIGETVRRNLFGAANPVGQDMRVGSMPCTVVAVLAPKGQSGFGQDQDDTVLIPLSAFRAGIYRMPNDGVSTIIVAALAPNVVRRAQESITSLLHQRHRIQQGGDDDFNVNNLSDIMNSFNTQVQVIAILLLVVASVSLIVGGIGVMNIMLVSVTERTREIGIRMAIGARSRDILSQFLIEAVVLAVIGGLAGLALGFGVSTLIGKATEFKIRFQPDIAAIAMAVSGGIGVIFGFFPARSAAKLDPIVALRHE